MSKSNYSFQIITTAGEKIDQYDENGVETGNWKKLNPAVVATVRFIPAPGKTVGEVKDPLRPCTIDIDQDDGEIFIKRFGRHSFKIDGSKDYYLHCIVTNHKKYWLHPNGFLQITGTKTEVRV